MQLFLTSKLLPYSQQWYRLSITILFDLIPGGFNLEKLGTNLIPRVKKQQQVSFIFLKYDNKVHLYFTPYSAELNEGPAKESLVHQFETISYIFVYYYTKKSEIKLSRGAYIPGSGLNPLTKIILERMEKGQMRKMRKRAVYQYV